LNPELYTQVLDELEMIFSHKPFQVLFYGSWERGTPTPDSDLNFYLLAHSTDQMKSSFVDSVHGALSSLEVVAPLNMIAGDTESLRHRMRIFEPGCLQLLESASVFFGENLLDGLKREWQTWQNREIPRKELITYLEKRIRFFKQQTTRNQKEEISQLERIATLTLQVWALRTIPDLTVPELLKMDIPGQIGSLFRILYWQELDEKHSKILDLAERIYTARRQIRHRREVSREEMHELKYKLIHLREEDGELLADLWV